MGIIQTKLREYRKANNLTQAKIAKLLGVTQQTYQEWESGKIEDLRSSTVIRLCKTLNVSADYMLGLADNIVPLCQDCNAEICKTLDVINTKKLKDEDIEFILNQIRQLKDSL